VLQHSLGMLQTMADEGRLADRSDPSDPPK
jgi:hypothetical protein